MASAVASIVSKTVDVLLKIQSTESRKQRWAKLLFSVYGALGDIEASMYNITQTLIKPEDRNDIAAELKRDVETFQAGIAKLSNLMGQETWDLFQLQSQPEKLKAMGIFDQEVTNVLIKAWFMDGGFVEAFHRMGLSYMFDQKIMRMTDAPFDPSSSVHGYAVKVTKTDFSLKKKADVQRLISILSGSRSEVVTARDALKSFIAKTFKIEDII